MPPLTPPPVTAAPRRVVRSFTFNDFVALRAFVFLAIVASLTLGLDFGCGIVTDRWRRPQWTERRRTSGRETSEERRQRQVGQRGQAKVGGAQVEPGGERVRNRHAGQPRPLG